MRRVLCTLVVLAGICATAQKPASVVPDRSSQRTSAVNLLRVINTAELNYHRQKGRFGDFHQLVSADLLKPGASQVPAASWPKEFNGANPNEPVPGLHLNLSLIAEGNGYQVAVVAGNGDAGERWGFYSDQDGLIFEMKPLS